MVSSHGGARNQNVERPPEFKIPGSGWSQSTSSTPDVGQQSILHVPVAWRIAAGGLPALPNVLQRACRPEHHQPNSLLQVPLVTQWQQQQGSPSQSLAMIHAQTAAAYQGLHAAALGGLLTGNSILGGQKTQTAKVSSEDKPKRPDDGLAPESSVSNTSQEPDAWRAYYLAMARGIWARQAAAAAERDGASARDATSESGSSAMNSSTGSSHSANVEHISQHLSSQDSVPSLRAGERVPLEAVAKKLELEKQELEKELTEVKAALESKTKAAGVRSASARIRELDALLEQRLVNQREYDGQKAAIIASV